MMYRKLRSYIPDENSIHTEAMKGTKLKIPATSNLCFVGFSL